MMYVRTQSRALVVPIGARVRAVSARHRGRGMGSTGTDTKIVQVGGSLATPIISGALASSAASSLAAGGSGLILGMAPTLAIPIIGAAIVGVTILLTYLIANSGCGVTCVETSSWANQAEPLLRQNIAAYFSIAAPRSQSQQNAALANFTATWTALVNLCGQPAMGDAGKACISDRQAGGCKWKATADSPWPGGPAQGACWNWWNAYHDPIANDPNVVPDSASTLASTALSSLGSLPSWVWLVAAGLVVVLL